MSTVAATLAPVQRWLIRRREAGLLGMVDLVTEDAVPPSNPLCVGPNAAEVGERLRRQFGRCAVADLPTDVTALPFDDGAFDLVVCLDGLVRPADPDRALHELARVCSHHLVLSLPRRPRGRWSKSNAQRLGSSVGAVRNVASPFPWTILWVTLFKTRG